MRMNQARLQHVLYESTEREAREFSKEWTRRGGTRETFARAIAAYDPVTYAARLRKRVVFMISASQDRTIPKKSTLALWKAAGEQRIIWYPCGHYSMVRYFIPALSHGISFFRQWPRRDEKAEE